MKLFLRSCALLWVAIPGALALELAGVFTDDMVLQRERPVPVWGTGKPGDQITVSFAGQKRSGKVGPTGRWQISLQPLKASAQPRDVVVVARLEKQTATITNVLVGEVWLGSGQSNMAWPLRNILNLQAIATLPADSQLRLFTVPRLISDTPNSTLTGRWTVSSSATLADFSAVGYFFGRDLRAAKGVPVGIICSAWGGTPVQAWTSQPALERVPQLRKRIVQHDAALANFDPVKAETDYQAALAKHQVAVAEAAAANKPAPQPPARPADPPRPNTAPPGSTTG